MIERWWDRPILRLRSIISGCSGRAMISHLTRPWRRHCLSTMIAPVEAEQEGGESRFLDHDGRVPRIDPANLPFILLFPRRQGRGYVQWIYYDVYEVEVRLTAFPVQKAANWLL